MNMRNMEAVNGSEAHLVPQSSSIHMFHSSHSFLHFSHDLLSCLSFNNGASHFRFEKLEKTINDYDDKRSR
jgi:hypothetical protein